MRSDEAQTAVRMLSDGPGGIAYRAIAADAWFSVRLVHHIQTMGEAGGALPSVLGPWWSMYLHEGRRVLRQRIPPLVSTMSADAESTFERSRHGLKMFLDNQRDVFEYENYFRLIDVAHRNHFVERIPRPVRWMGRDLGVYLYNGHVLSTTHGYAFSSGLEPEAVLDKNMGRRLHDLWVEGGAAFAMAALAVHGPAPAATHTWDLALFASQDQVSGTYYTAMFTGEERPHLNAVLLHYLGMLNAANTLFSVVPSEPDDMYVLFKMRYVAVAHVFGSLKKLSSEGDLTPSTIDVLKSVIDGLPNPQAASRSWLRNLLVHYEPNPRSDLSKVSGADLLTDVLALVEVGETAAHMVKETNENLAYLTTALESWMNGWPTR